MLYPVYVHLGDGTHAHGVTIPDFPGCFSAADDWQDLPRMVQEAIEVYCEGENMGLDCTVFRAHGGVATTKKAMERPLRVVAPLVPKP